MPQFIVKSQNITLPKFFIDVLMPNANPTFVKVYLYALMLANDNMSIDNITIANKLGILESDVVGAFSYWKSQGILDVNDGYVEFLPMPAIQMHQPQSTVQPPHQHIPIQKPIHTPPAPVQTVNTPATLANTNVNQPKQYDSVEVAKAISENEVLAELALVAQTMLGKPLNTQDTNTLYSLYDWLGFQPEIILLLLDHCVSKGKANMKYIEKVAISWHENGLFTADAVTKYLENSSKKNSYIYNVRKILGILDRNPVAKEENYIKIWFEEYEMSEDMVALAYEYCVMQTQKLSMPYIDKILARWHSQGITTIQAAQQDNENFKAKNTPKNLNPQSSNYNVNNSSGYDYKNIEKQMWENMKK